MATTLTFGKYNGKTLEQVAAIDPGYLQWMAGERINRGGINFSTLAAQYLKTHEIVEPEICPICENTSCGGPSEHETSAPYWRLPYNEQQEMVRQGKLHSCGACTTLIPSYRKGCYLHSYLDKKGH